MTLGRALRWLIVLGVWCAVGLGGLLAYYAYDLPDVSRMAVLERQPAVTLLAKDGSILAASGQLTGEALRVEELPPHCLRPYWRSKTGDFTNIQAWMFWGWRAQC